MGRLVTLMAVLGVLAAPAALADKPAAKHDQNAAQECRAQLKSMGAKDFRSLWGNFGQCVALTAQQNQENVESGEEQCRAARANDAAAFKDKYHSFGRCVSQTAKAMAQEQQQKTLNAASGVQGRAAKDAAQFRTTYGKGKRNAFANCVAAKKSG